MSIDLSKLTPAPWIHEASNTFECISAGEYGKPGYCHSVVSYTIDDDGVHGANESDMPFIALARNAFDVRMRRKWQSHWMGEEWVAGYPSPMPLDMPPFFSDDPDSCLVEADRWYKENVEKDS